MIFSTFQRCNFLMWFICLHVTIFDSFKISAEVEEEKFNESIIFNTQDLKLNNTSNPDAITFPEEEENAINPPEPNGLASPGELNSFESHGGTSLIDSAETERFKLQDSIKALNLTDETQKLGVGVDENQAAIERPTGYAATGNYSYDIVGNLPSEPQDEKPHEDQGLVGENKTHRLLNEGKIEDPTSNSISQIIDDKQMRSSPAIELPIPSTPAPAKLLAPNSSRAIEVEAHSSTESDEEESLNYFNEDVIKHYVLPDTLKQTSFSQCFSPNLTDSICRSDFPLYYFEGTTNSCLPFLYHDCDSEARSFEELNGCFSYCHPSSTLLPSRKSPHQELPTESYQEQEKVLSFDGRAFISYDIQLDKREMLQLSFTLRTFASNSDVISIIEDAEDDGTSIQIYIKIIDGDFGVEIIRGEDRETFLLEIGSLQDGSWNSFLLQYFPMENELVLEVNTMTEVFSLIADTNGASNRSNFRVWVGGIPLDKMLEAGAKSVQVPFTGCTKWMQILCGDKFISLTSLEQLQEATNLQAYVGNECMNRCVQEVNICGGDSTCLERFDQTLCRCMHLHSKENGESCSHKGEEVVLTLSGEDFLSYRINSHLGKRTSSFNQFSFKFKTSQADSILLYLSEKGDEGAEERVLSLTITEQQQLMLHFQSWKEDASRLISEKANLTDGAFHSVMVVHQYRKVSLFIDGERISLHPESLEDVTPAWEFDSLFLGGHPSVKADCRLLPIAIIPPEECQGRNGTSHYYNVSEGVCQSYSSTGCEDELNNFSDGPSCINECYIKGLPSYNFFAGCLKEVYFNEFDILQGVKESIKSVRYHSDIFREVPLDSSCLLNERPSVSLTSTSDEIRVVYDQRSTDRSSFNLAFSFLPKRREDTTLAFGSVDDLLYEYRWELQLLLGGDLRFVVPSFNLSLHLQSVINSDHWNEVELNSKDNFVSLTSNAKSVYEDISLFFISGFTFGNSQSDAPGFVGCIKDVFIDGEYLDLRSYVGSSLATSGVRMDRCKVLTKCERKSCPGDSYCVEEYETASCICDDHARDNFGCYFDKLRTSCEEYNFVGFNTSTTYPIKVKGNPKRVHCSFDPEMQRTSTIITHNLPNEYVVRRDLNNFKIDITYRDFKEDELKKFLRGFSKCSQSVNFSCRKAPLNLINITTYSSLWTEKISSLGSEVEGACSCHEDGTCSEEEVACNCDISDDLMRNDAAVITDMQKIPVTSFSFMTNPEQQDDSILKLTLGNLECWNEVQSQMTFLKTEDSFIKAPAWTEKELTFSFRTRSSSRGNIFSQVTLNSFIQMKMISEYKIEFHYKNEEMENKIIFEEDVEINSGNWNFVWMEFAEEHLKVILNNQEEIFALGPKPFDAMAQATAYLGAIEKGYEGPPLNDTKGFVGCIKNLIIEGEIVHLMSVSLTSAHGASPGCAFHCDGVRCENGAKCFEETDSFECRCPNPFSQSGVFCEKDYNKESAVTFLSPDSEIFYYNSSSIEDQNPFSNNFTFSIRTRESEAMLFVAIDHLQNILQVYLENPYRVSMSFNHGKELRHLSVDTPDVALNEGQSVQITVVRSADSSILIVFTEGNEYFQTEDVGALLLTEDHYEQFPYEVHPLLVRYQQSFTLPTSFFLIFIGGVKSAGIESTLPGLIGCFRGLQINGVLIDLTDQSIWNWGPNVKQGCSTACDEGHPCKNGGKCLASFQTEGAFECDCKGSSYVGERCEDEIAYYFNGSSWLGLEDWTMKYNDSVFIEISFSLTNEERVADQLLLFAKLENEREEITEIAIFIEEEFIRVEIFEGKSSKMTGVALSEASNIRYHLQLSKQESQFFIQLNGKEGEPPFNIFKGQNILGNNPFGFLLSGAKESLLESSETKSFQGCMANVLLLSSFNEFRPLKMYSEGYNFYQEGSPVEGKCAREQSIPVTQRLDFYELPEISPWAYPEPARIPIADGKKEGPSNKQPPPAVNVTESYEYMNTTTATTEEPKNAPVWPWVLFAIFVIALLLFLIAILVRRHQKKKMKRLNISGRRSSRSSLPMTHELPPPQITLLEREPSVIRAQNGNRGHPQESIPLLENTSMANPSPSYAQTNEIPSDQSQELDIPRPKSPPPPYSEEDPSAPSLESIAEEAQVSQGQNSSSSDPTDNQPSSNVLRPASDSCGLVETQLGSCGEIHQPTYYYVLPHYSEQADTASFHTSSSQSIALDRRSPHESSASFVSPDFENKETNVLKEKLNNLEHRSRPVSLDSSIGSFVDASEEFEFHRSRETLPDSTTKANSDSPRSVSTVDSLAIISPWTIRKLIPWHSSSRSNNE